MFGREHDDLAGISGDCLAQRVEDIDVLEHRGNGDDSGLSSGGSWNRRWRWIPSHREFGRTTEDWECSPGEDHLGVFSRSDSHYCIVNAYLLGIRVEAVCILAGES